MTRQGSCLDELQDDDFILDRLAGLSKVIPRSVMEQALIDSGRNHQRACKLCHRSMLWIVLAMGPAHPSADSPGLQARAADAARRKNTGAKQPVRRPTASRPRTGAARFRFDRETVG